MKISRQMLLVGQVITVSLETQRIIAGLSDLGLPEG
jgi:hypothetical protein